MTFPLVGSPILEPVAPRVSRAGFEFDVATATVDPDTGAVLAASGHVGTFSRGVTLASVDDATGATYTAAGGAPAWTFRDWDGDAQRDAAGWHCNTSDRLSFPFEARPSACAFVLEFWQLAGVFARWYIGNDAATGARLWITNSGSVYGLYHHNGVSPVQSVLAAAPATGDRVRLIGTLAANGAVQLRQSLNGGTDTIAAASGALALPAAWSGTTMRLNTLGTGSAGGAVYRRVRLLWGALDVDRLTARA